MSFIDGLSSGLDTTSIINQLMQIERRPQAALTSRRAREEAARTELSEIRSEITAIRNTAADLRLTNGWDRLKATSSNETAVTVEPGSASATGSYSFQVTSVATAASVYATNVFASLNDPVAVDGATYFAAAGYENRGIQSITGSGFAPGAVGVSVVQASREAEIEGVGIPVIPIEVDGTNDDIEFEVEGFTFSVALAHGNYDTEAALADGVAQAIAAHPVAGQLVTAAAGDAGNVVLRTTAGGSSHTLAVTGGDALASLGLTAGVSATGTDGIVDLNGSQTTIDHVAAGEELTITDGAGGSITVVMAGQLSEGAVTASQETFGSGSLADVVATVNAGDFGYTAAAVNTGSGYRLQLTATETGADSTIDIDPAVFGALDFTVLFEGTDAELTVQGQNPFTITSSTNTFESLLPGVTVTVKAVTTAPVTISTERDVEAVTASLDQLVTRLNELLDRVASSTSNEPTGDRTILQGNREARRAADELRRAFVAPMDANRFTSIGVVGIELTRDGNLTFDQDKFRQAFLGDPEAMTALFADRAVGATAPGALDRLIEAAEAASSVGQGYLYTATQASERRIDDYGKQIDAFERRFEIREATLRQTYANLEVALSGLQQQSSHLASQLGSLGGNTR
ncbi:MAG: flagellar filament capping protein FliD [Acidimicrobiales bacterium]